MNIGKLNPGGVKPADLAANGPGKNEDLKGKTDFSKALQEAGSKAPTSADAAKDAEKPLLIKFSNHAVDRMRTRGISFEPKVLAAIDDAVTKAGDKGAKETLVIADNAAMIANTENKTIVTVMDKEMLKENIFTQIDAAVIV